MALPATFEISKKSVKRAKISLCQHSFQSAVCAAAAAAVSATEKLVCCGQQQPLTGFQRPVNYKYRNAEGEQQNGRTVSGRRERNGRKREREKRRSPWMDGWIDDGKELSFFCPLLLRLAVHGEHIRHNISCTITTIITTITTIKTSSGSSSEPLSVLLSPFSIYLSLGLKFTQVSEEAATAATDHQEVVLLTAHSFSLPQFCLPFSLPTSATLSCCCCCCCSPPSPPSPPPVHSVT